EIMGYVSSPNSLQYSSAIPAIKGPKIKRETVSEMINRKKIAGKLPVLKPIVLPTPKPMKNISKFQIKSRMAGINPQDRVKTLEARIKDFKARMGVKPQFHARSAFEKHGLTDKIKTLHTDFMKKTPLKHRLASERVGSPLIHSRFGSDESTKEKTNENKKEGDESVLKTGELKKKHRVVQSSVSEIPVIVLGPSASSNTKASEKSSGNTESDDSKIQTRSAVFERMKGKQKDAMDKIRSKLSTNNID
ncbi:hypothetical protein GWI33_011655, partial [Rhynchophorus ferrugineus]